MSQDKIDVKDVTPKVFNPKPHKGKAGIALTQVIASMFVKVKEPTRNCAVMVAGFCCCCLDWFLGSLMAIGKPSCLILATSNLTSSEPPSTRKI